MDSVSALRRAAQEEIWRRAEAIVAERLQAFLNRLMNAERDALLGCGWHERSPHRRGHRNGFVPRFVHTRQGRLKLSQPRVRGTATPFRTLVLDAYARRAPRVEEAVERWVAAGCSTREVADLLLGTFDSAVSPATISAIIGQIDAEVRAFHERPLERGYRVVWLDGKHGRVRKPPRQGRRGRKREGVVLVAWGLRHDGREELVDYQAAQGAERYEVWEAFLTRLEARGLRPRNRWDEPLELLVTDGDGGLEAACDMVYPTVPRQRCLFHKIRNLADHLVDRDHRGAILASASRIWEGVQTIPEAQQRFARWAQQWRAWEPEAVDNLAADFDQTLRYLNLPPDLWPRVRTNNPIERLMLELEKGTGHVPLWEDLAAWERHIWIVWKKLTRMRYRPTRARSPNQITQKS